MGKFLGLASVLLLMPLVGLTALLVRGMVPFLWEEHPILLIGIAVGGATVGITWHRRVRGSRAANVPQASASVHPGIRLHAVPIAGGIGLVFTIGYCVMFWAGAPGTGSSSSALPCSAVSWAWRSCG